MLNSRNTRPIVQDLHKQSGRNRENCKDWGGEGYPEWKGGLRGGSRDAWTTVPGWRKQLKARGEEHRDPES